MKNLDQKLKKIEQDKRRILSKRKAFPTLKSFRRIKITLY